MNWIRGGKYHLTSDRFNIAKIPRPNGKTLYELWEKTTKILLASELATDQEDAQRAIAFLKSIAEAS